MSTRRNRPARIASIAATFAFGTLLVWHVAALGEDKTTAAALFHQLDKSGDGVLTMDEATLGTRSYLERIFKAAGKGPADRVSREEFLAAHERLHSKSPSSGAKTSAHSPAARPAPASSDAPPDGIQFIDENGDGLISRAEWSKFLQRFSSLDTDKDNSLSDSELQAVGGAADALMKIADANGDGKISRVEWGRLSQGFTRFDANRDKSLDLAELQKAADTAVASAAGSASLSAGNGKAGAKKGPTLWRGRIDGRGGIELLVNGNYIVGREFNDGNVESLGAGTFTMSGDGKSGNMDAAYTEGEHAGQVCLGIYKFEGDTLLWCVNNKGARPDSFSGGDGNWLLTLTRVDADPSTK